VTLVLPALDFKDDVDAAVAAYFRAGLRPLLIHAPNGNGRCTCGLDRKDHKVGKHPIHKNWQKPRSFDEVQDQLARLKFKPNIGILLGEQPGGEYIVAVDVDDIDRLEALEKELGKLPTTAQCDSGRGYRVLYELGSEIDRSKLRNITALTPNKKPEDVAIIGVDVKVSGGQIVVAPSLHENGKHYSWSRVGSIAILPSSWGVHLLQYELPKDANQYTPLTLKDNPKLKKRWDAYLNKSIDGNCRAVANAPEGTRNNTLNTCAIALFSLSNGLSLQIRWSDISRALVHAATHAGLHENEAKKTISGAEKRVLSTGQVRVPVALTDPGTHPGISPSSVLLPPISADDPLNAIALQDDRGAPAKTAGNVALLLSLHPVWRGGPAFDAYSQTEIWPEPIPEPIASIHRAEREIVDADHSALQQWLMSLPSSHRVRVGQDVVAGGVHLASSRKRIDLLKQWIGLLPTWEGTLRLERWTTIYLGCDDNAYTRATGRAWLIAAIERALTPGIHVDVAPVLEGPQKSGKNHALETLFAGGPSWAPWLCGVRGDAMDRDEAKRIACGRWILHDDEMRAREPKYLDAIKSWHSRTRETYRLPYAREITVAMRRGLLVTSTNLRTYLHDDTGNRRWWPWTTGRIAIEKLARDRAQLLSEALAAVRRGDRWRNGVTDAVYLEALQVADERRVVDPLLEQLHTLIETGSFRGVAAPEVLTTQTIGTVLGYSIDKIDRAFETRVGAAMRELGFFVQRQTIKNGTRVRAYLRGIVGQVDPTLADERSSIAGE
jgi:putative DNA primase/helicase